MEDEQVELDPESGEGDVAMRWERVACLTRKSQDGFKV